MLGLKRRLCSPKAVFSSKRETSTIFYAPYSSVSYIFIFPTPYLARQAAAFARGANQVFWHLHTERKFQFTSLRKTLSINKAKKTHLAGIRNANQPFSSLFLQKKPCQGNDTSGKRLQHDHTCRIKNLFFAPLNCKQLMISWDKPNIDCKQTN